MDFVIGNKTFKLTYAADVVAKQHVETLHGILSELEQQRLKPVSIENIFELIEHFEKHSVQSLVDSKNPTIAEEQERFIIFLRSLVVVKSMRIPQLISDFLNDKETHPLLKVNDKDFIIKLNDVIMNSSKFSNLSAPLIHLAWMIARSWELPSFPDQDESRQHVTKLMLLACKSKIFCHLNNELQSPYVSRSAQTKQFDILYLTVHSLISSLLQLYDICSMKDNISLEIELLINQLLVCKKIPVEPFSATLLNQSCCKLFNHLLNEKRPPRLNVAVSLASVNTQLNRRFLNTQDVVKHLSRTRFLPYMIGLMRKNTDIAFGRDTNASTIGELIVSEECIRGTYELCLSFLEFVLNVVSDETYQDDSKSLLASVIYILNEIYPSYQLWIFKNQNDMKKVLSLCTAIFHKILSNINSYSESQQLSDLEIVCIISLSQGRAYHRLLDVIISSREAMKDIVEQLDPTTEADLRKSPHLIVIRQSLIILNRLLSHSKFVEVQCDTIHPSRIRDQNQKCTNADMLMVNIEKALDNIRPSLIHHLFYYVYQRDDCTASCLAVSLIKQIAKKFSMSLMASLGSEADVVCEFFLSRLEDYEEDANLTVAILDLLATCVQHQPGLIELFLNARQDHSKPQDKQTLPSIMIIMRILKDCKQKQEDSYKLLHTYLLKLLLTLWQRRHSAIHHFDKCESFWETLTYPLIRHVELNGNETQAHSSTNIVSYNGAESFRQVKTLNEKLNSYALMILAREMFYTDPNVKTNERQLSNDLKSVFDGMARKNLLTKHSNLLQTRHYSVTKTLIDNTVKVTSAADQTNDACLNRSLSAWRDFLAACVRFETLKVESTTRMQLLSDILECTTNELRLNEELEKDRAALLSDTLLLVALKWMPKETYSEQLFKSMHNLLYLTNSCKDYLPFSSLLALQTTFNHYLLCQKIHLDSELNAASDLILPAVELMSFSFLVYEKGVANLARLESRLCLLSVSALKFVVDLSRRYASLWLKFVKLDVIVQFLVELLDKQPLDLDASWALMDLLICMASVPQVGDYLHRSGFVNELNMMAVSAYEAKKVSSEGKSQFYVQLIKLNITLWLMVGRDYMNSVVEFILNDIAEAEGQHKLAHFVRKMPMATPFITLG